MRSLRASIRLAGPVVLCLGLLAPSCRDEPPAPKAGNEPAPPAATESKPAPPAPEPAAPEPIRLYAIFDVSNPERLAGELSVSWLAPDGKERDEVALSYPEQPKWRTWAFHSHVAAPGRWEAIVRADDGTELGRAPFDVTP